VRLTLFIEGGDAAHAPEIDLDHISPVMHDHHCCHSDGTHSDSFQVSLHHFTPAHARQLIEMLTPIAAIVEHTATMRDETSDEHGPRWRSICTCGSLGLPRETKDEALNDSEAHVAVKEAVA